jgi:hypothetical protein
LVKTVKTTTGSPQVKHDMFGIESGIERFHGSLGTSCLHRIKVCSNHSSKEGNIVQHFFSSIIVGASVAQC